MECPAGVYLVNDTASCQHNDASLGPDTGEESFASYPCEGNGTHPGIRLLPQRPPGEFFVPAQHPADAFFAPGVQPQHVVIPAYGAPIGMPSHGASLAPAFLPLPQVGMQDLSGGGQHAQSADLVWDWSTAMPMGHAMASSSEPSDALSQVWQGLINENPNVNRQPEQERVYSEKYSSYYRAAVDFVRQYEGLAAESQASDSFEKERQWREIQRRHKNVYTVSSADGGCKQGDHDQRVASLAESQVTPSCSSSPRGPSASWSASVSAAAAAVASAVSASGDIALRVLGKAEQGVQCCLQSPASSSTKTPSSAGSAAALSQCEDDLSIASPRSTEVPHLELLPAEEDQVPEQDPAPRLQRQLTRLRKHLREAKRFEDRMRSGAVLNMDQQLKAERLARVKKQLCEEIQDLESRLGTTPEAVDTRDSGNSHDECAPLKSCSTVGISDCGISNNEFTPAQSSSALATGIEPASNVSPEKKSARRSQDIASENARRCSASKHVVTSSNVHGRSQRQPGKKKATIALPAPQANGEKEGEGELLQSSRNAWASLACGMLLGTLVILLAESRALFPSEIDTADEWEEMQNITDVQTVDLQNLVMHLLPAGASHAWTASKPQDAFSDVGDRLVDVTGYSLDVEIASSHTLAWHMLATVKRRGEKRRAGKSGHLAVREPTPLQFRDAMTLLQRHAPPPGSFDSPEAWQSYQEEVERRKEVQELEFSKLTSHWNEEQHLEFSEFFSAHHVMMQHQPRQDHGQQPQCTWPGCVNGD